MNEESLLEELATFERLWAGGYYEGDVLDPVGASGYGELGYVSSLHAVYLCCIKPFVCDDSCVLEIGPGRGAWTRTLLRAKEVWCLDAKSRQDNGIDEALGWPTNLIYHQVRDFRCLELPDDKFDYAFSFGALCHVSWDGIVQYAHNLHPKLKHGANAFWMVADYDKSNMLRRERWRFDVIGRVRAARYLRILRAVDRRLGRWLGHRGGFLGALSKETQARLERLAGLRLLGRTAVPYKDKSEDPEPSPGRWYHAGGARTATLLSEVGYEVVSSDVGLVHRDPIIHFRRP